MGEFQNCGSCYHRIRSAAERKKKFAGESLTPGKIYLVGAGPGHPELLTVKAAKLLEASDVIVYDRLIQEEILALAKPSTERIYMGKSVGIHGSRQEEICEVCSARRVKARPWCGSKVATRSYSAGEVKRPSFWRNTESHSK